MCFVIVKFNTWAYNPVIDGRMPITTTGQSAFYWVPKVMVDDFITRAMDHDDVVQCTQYTYKRTYKK